MRKEIVAHLESNPCESDDLPLLEHLVYDEFARRDDHLTHITRDGKYRDQMTMHAAANL